ncbi:MAG: hypothetical protein ACR2G5_04810 [Pyrinomonadaceae bacterium]
MARRIEEEGITESDTPTARYCYIVARFVFMEYLRGAEKDRLLTDDMRRQPYNFAESKPVNEKETQEKLLNCL